MLHCYAPIVLQTAQNALQRNEMKLNSLSNTFLTDTLTMTDSFRHFFIYELDLLLNMLTKCVDTCMFYFRELMFIFLRYIRIMKTLHWRFMFKSQLIFLLQVVFYIFTVKLTIC